MQPLIVATSEPASRAADELRTHDSPRVDYVELSRRCATQYVDYGVGAPNRILRRLEDSLRLDIGLALQVTRIIGNDRYGAILSMSERVGIPLGLLLGHRVRHVLFAHHLLSPPKLRFIKALGIAPRWDLIIVHTHAECEEAQRLLHLGAERVHMLFGNVDCRFYRPVPDQMPHQRDYILSLGLAERDYSTLITALRKLPYVTCYIGMNSLWIRSAGGNGAGRLPRNVLMQPYLPATTIRDRYDKCRFVVVSLRSPTTHWSAGISTVMVAQAMGKAVIATDNPGMRSYVAHGDTGILVRGGDAEAMAEAIEYLWNRPEEASAMGHRARLWAESKYSLDLWLDNVSRLIDTVVL